MKARSQSSWTLTKRFRNRLSESGTPWMCARIVKKLSARQKQLRAKAA